MYSDASAQSELVDVGYARVFTVAISASGGHGEQQDQEIFRGLHSIFFFLNYLQGAYSMPLQPLLVRRSVEQIEEEGAIEEIDAQLINDGHYNCNIKEQTNNVKRMILNYFINKSNRRPFQFNR
ncbi:MAG: hypothetical protein EZS28_003196 [Streblomastix strix]|uniref:Uncharacterized protein n=1 Tax=Streblomastix strix TaxID=222440 RepID=A0A5J4X439_9EUKA|nr:MAG: hypothetical protein EZS28_003196 [Streblomastix strix]